MVVGIWYVANWGPGGRGEALREGLTSKLRQRERLGFASGRDTHCSLLSMICEEFSGCCTSASIQRKQSVA